MSEFKYTIAVDFDGVIHSYSSPWTSPEEIPDPPVEGAREGLRALREEFLVAIYSTRAEKYEGRLAIAEYCRKHGLEFDSISARKPRAVRYIDDRGYCFDGDWERVVDAARGGFTPWNKS